MMIGEILLDELDHDNQEDIVAGAVIPTEVGFVPRVTELFTLLEYYYQFVLDGSWQKHFDKRNDIFFDSAEERVRHIIKAIRKLPRDCLRFFAEVYDRPDDDDPVFIVPRADEVIRESMAQVEGRYFHTRDPRFVRSFKGEATPEDEHEVREALKRGHHGYKEN